jgi:hypothetical protein
LLGGECSTESEGSLKTTTHTAHIPPEQICCYRR